MAAHSIAVIGLGKIAQDQHLPVIAKNPAFRLVATVSQRGLAAGDVPSFRTAEELLAAMPDIESVSICTPPNVRFALARQAILAGKHVLLEKPPFPTTSEMAALADIARAQRRTVFTTWHSQYNAAVEATRTFLADRTLSRLTITWKEDVRRWHPGQDWIWESGGFGVFDPGINALSILTRIMPEPVFVERATLETPSNKIMPIAADLTFRSLAMDGPSEAFTAAFDWRQEGEQSWDYLIETADGHRLDLTRGGSRLAIDGAVTVDETSAEYEKIYDRFAELLDAGESLIDAAPFQLVADAFMVGRRVETAAFAD